MFYILLLNLSRYGTDLSLMIGLPSHLYGADMMHAVEFVAFVVFLSVSYQNHTEGQGLLLVNTVSSVLR